MGLIEPRGGLILVFRATAHMKKGFHRFILASSKRLGDGEGYTYGYFVSFQMHSNAFSQASRLTASTILAVEQVIHQMSIVPISFSEFGQKRFRRYDSYAFAAQDAIVPLAVREMPRAAMVMPTAFVKADQGFVPVAVQGLAPGKNLFVAPDGRWVGRYVPAAYRGYPFVLANTQDGKQVLCFESTSGLLSDTEGEPFFDGEQPTKAVNDILNFLNQVAVSRQATQRICAVLEAHQLIQPWPIKLNQEPRAGDEPMGRNIEGLFRIDEAALNKLDAAALHAVQQGGGLPLIFCQLLSMQHLPSLGQLATAYYEAEQHAALPKTEAGEIDLSFLADDTTISFENL